MPTPGPLELVLILVIVAMLFGVGKLPEVFGAVGKGVREFRTNASGEKGEETEQEEETPEIAVDASTDGSQTESVSAATTGEPEPAKAAETTQAT